jgi:alkylation response protein AidB-like acyl-CoA dehydrogenase
VDFHPSYHAIGRLAYASGAMAAYAHEGREWETLSLVYLLAQNGEGGHTCPMACTAGLIQLLKADKADHSLWLDRLTDPDYDTHFHGAQFLTEVQGGSDVGANAVVATQAEGEWRLTGEKWFCSVIDADLFVVTARVDDQGGTRGLRAFAVPRRLPNGDPNGFAIRRLKYKLGTRSMASAEVDFHGARGTPIGDFRTTVDIVLNTSRLYNAICSCGILQRAWREAQGYAEHRLAFGQPILAFPTVARILARLRTEAYAARASTFFLAHLRDQPATDPHAFRMLVNLNKYWTSSTGTSAVRDAIEVLGGNGAIESFSVLPRLLRDAIVCEAWEGGHNVLCAQVLRDAQRSKMHRRLFALIRGLGGSTERLDDAERQWDRLVTQPPEVASIYIRDLVDDLRPVVQAAVLRAEVSSHSDPLIAIAAEHLLTLNARTWDPLADPTLMERVNALTSRR